MTDQTTALAALARIRQMTDHWEQRLPETIRTPAVVSALRAVLDRAPTAPLPLADQTTPLRDRIAAAVRTIQLRLGPNAVAMSQRGEPIILNLNEADDLADAVLAVLPATTNHDTDTGTFELRGDTEIRAAALREAADEAASAARLFPDNEECATAVGALEGLAERLRRVADETAATETQAAARQDGSAS